MSVQRYASNLRVSSVSSSTSGAKYRTVPTRLLGATSMEFVSTSCLTARPGQQSAATLIFTELSYGYKGKGSPYLITESRVPELIPVLGSQPAGDVSHKSGGRRPLLSTNFAVW